MQTLFICALIGIAIGFLVVGLLVLQLKTVRSRNEARNYILSESFSLTHSRDTYLYSNVVRSEKPQTKK